MKKRLNPIKLLTSIRKNVYLSKVKLMDMPMYKLTSELNLPNDMPQTVYFVEKSEAIKFLHRMRLEAARHAMDGKRKRKRNNERLKI